MQMSPHISDVNLAENACDNVISGDALHSDDTSSFLANTTENDQDFFIADLGASIHMTFRRDFFHNQTHWGHALK